MKFSTLSTFSLVYITTVATTAASSSNGQCAVWYKVLNDIQTNLFEGGKCGDDAHDALRLSFHDAIGYSPKMFNSKPPQFGGNGADGSLIKFASTELNYHANNGLEEIVGDLRNLADKYKVSYGDIIQFAAAVSVGNCQGGPSSRVPFMAGRPDATQAAPDLLVPEPFDSVEKMLARVGDAGLSPEELVDLLASHSVGDQEHIDPSIPGTPFDTTPSILDTKFYRDTLVPGHIWPGDGQYTGEAKSPTPGQFRLQSDVALAFHPRTILHWISLALGGQDRMASRFATAMGKMALLGQNPKILYDCSAVIPVPK
ncbi:Peroxidase [Mycena venus]|uniref:Peroxidase n=1 Tax=Mycena venus TaxID=2733690 RepID=A0A8H7CMC7_9AGAR|nr:Peroxidase [Mycena venus]